MRRVLMIAFHFPPMRGSSGLQRTLKFAQYLPELGWETRVLTVNPRAYPDTTSDQLPETRELSVRRIPCWDAAKHFSIAGRYPRHFALPDRWSSWLAAAVPIALWDCATWRPDVIWSTFPICTAHVLGSVVHRLTGIPWVADLRDSMTEDEYPRDERVRKLFRRIERRVVRQSSALVFTAPGTRRMYGQRYPDAHASSWHVIPNGYDEENFAAAEALHAAAGESSPRRIVHSGLLDPVDRDPSSLFDAVAELKRRNLVRASELQIILRATGHDATHAAQIRARGIDDLIQLAPPIPYAQALAEMLGSHALLLFQAPNCNHQIPAKLYEYLRARRPILCVTDAAGDTAAEAKAAGIRRILPVRQPAELTGTLAGFLSGEIPADEFRATEAAVTASSRRGQARRLAAVLDSVRRGG